MTNARPRGCHGSMGCARRSEVEMGVGIGVGVGVGVEMGVEMGIGVGVG